MAAAHGGSGGDAVLERFRPRGVRIVGGAVFTILALSPVVTWLLLPDSARDRFVGADLALTIFLYALFGGAGYAVLRCRVDATDETLVVVNGYRRHELAWTDIARLGLPQGAPFARLETRDDRSIQMLGIQGSDGAYAKEATLRLRRMHQERTR